MKIKTTLILLAVVLALLAVVLFIKPKPKEDKSLQMSELKSEAVQQITLQREAETLSFKKSDKDEWTITEPLEAPADRYEVDRLAEDFSSLKAERVVDADPKDLKEYGIPKTTVTLRYKDQVDPLTFVLGNENAIDNTLYAQKKGEKRVVLLPSSFKSLLEKKLIDFRQKDAFRVETTEVKDISLRAKDIRWRAALKDGEWYLEEPIYGLAQKYKVESVLNSLVGLRAKEFVAEQKTAQDLKAYGLDKPDYEATLSLPQSNQAVTFYVHKKDDKVYATTSLSPKVILAEDQVLTDLEKKPDELREKGVEAFNSWQATSLEIRQGALVLALSKDKDGHWQFASGGKAAADDSKVESFIRKIDSLEAAEFIDKPAALSAYGLDKPRATIKIGVEEEEGKAREVTILVGTEDAAKKQVVVRNPRFNYLFRCDSSFLAEFPKEAKDWTKEEPKGKTP